MKHMILIGYMLGGIISFTGNISNGFHLTLAAMAPSTEEKQILQLRTVNGISLYDDQSIVIEKKGEPELITEDPYIKGFEIYHYPDMKIIFSDGTVNFVEVLEGAETLTIDGIPIPATVQALKEALGEPDFIAEDGIVFQRREALLKVFIDRDTQKLTSIHYYHISAV
jgi:peptidoglycan hydrolase-like protein with peptidoglycan-binding domain